MTTTNKKPKLNVTLLKRVLRHISKVPARFDMDVFSRDTDYSAYYAGPTKPACGTQACIAGWALLLNAGGTIKVWRKLLERERESTSGMNWHNEAVKLLGITEQEANSLFYWAGGEAGTAEHVQHAKDRINLLIKDRDKFVETY
jgi:hypothetical protein